MTINLLSLYKKPFIISSYIVNRIDKRRLEKKIQLNSFFHVEVYRRIDIRNNNILTFSEVCLLKVGIISERDIMVFLLVLFVSMFNVVDSL